MKIRLFKSPAFLFTLKFSGTLALLLCIFTLFESIFERFFLLPVSKAGYIVLSLFVEPVSFDASLLGLGFCNYVIPGQVLQVNFGCTGIYVLFILLSGIIAFPASHKKMLYGVLFALVSFCSYSIFRLFSMGLVGYFLPQYLEFVHNYLMVLLNAAFILYIYSYWINSDVNKLNISFFFRLLGISMLLLVLWEPLSFLYIYLVSGCTEIIFSITGYPVDLNVEAGVLKMIFPPFMGDPLRFSMENADHIFLNILMFTALYASSYKIPIGNRLKSGFSLATILLFVHICVVYMYTSTTITDYMNSQSVHLKTAADLYLSTFPAGSPVIFKSLMFHWNSWGWDLIPILLWIPAGIQQGLVSLRNSSFNSAEKCLSIQ